MNGDRSRRPIDVRVVIADDHTLVRAGLRRLIDEMPGMEAVGEACDGRQAVELVDELRPDVVLMDVTMPGLNGLSALVEIKARHPEAKVVMISMHDNAELVWQALRGGAAGYLLKDAEAPELELAIRSVHRSGTYLSPRISHHVVSGYVAGSHGRTGTLDRLTPRQVEIAQLIAEGQTNQEIADTLGVSVKTVEAHRSQLMSRLDIHDVAGIVRFAVRMGLVDADL